VGIELVVADEDDLAAVAADRVADELRKAIQDRGRAALAVSGGSTPRQMFAALATHGLPWRSIDLFQVDERVAPPGSSDRNANGLVAELVRKAGIPHDRFHPMPVDSHHPERAVGAYAALIHAVCGGIFDVAHLGLGDDGHTASLVPNDPVLDITASDIAMTATYKGHVRMTMTLPLLDRARRILWLVGGPAKAPVLPLLLRSDPSIPAGRVRNNNMIVVADTAAAAQTNNRETS
jgi:6-phosphogluconolactonase